MLPNPSVVLTLVVWLGLLLCGLLTWCAQTRRFELGACRLKTFRPLAKKGWWLDRKVLTVLKPMMSLLVLIRLKLGPSVVASRKLLEGP